MRKKVLDLTISEAIRYGVLKPTYNHEEIEGNWYLPLLDANEEIEIEGE